MNTRAAFSITSLLCAAFLLLNTTLFASSMPSSTAVVGPGQWQKLGQRRVNYGLDRDEIFITGREGSFSKVKLMVKRSGITMHRMIVHFANGSQQKIELRQNISAGSATRTIDINGRRRVIKKVVFVYDTKNFRSRKAVVELWGRR